MRKIRQELMQEQRPTKTPVGDRPGPLRPRVPLDEANYAYRWVNDRGDRILDLMEMGWIFVKNDGSFIQDRTADTGKFDGSLISKRVGGGITAYLMAMPRELFEERQAAKHELADEQEHAMYEAVRATGNYGKITVQRK